MPLSSTEKIKKQKSPLKKDNKDNEKQQKKMKKNDKEDKNTETDIEIDKNYQGDESSLQIKSLRNSKSDRMIVTHRQKQQLMDQIKTVRTTFKDKSDNSKSPLSQINHYEEKSELILKNLDLQNQITNDAIKFIIKNNQGASKSALKQKQQDNFSVQRIQKYQANSRNSYNVDSKRKNQNVSPKKFQIFNESEKFQKKNKRSNSQKSNDQKSLNNIESLLQKSDKSSQFRASFKKNPKIGFYVNSIETIIANNNDNLQTKELNIIQNQSEEYNSSVELDQNYAQTKKQIISQTVKKNGQSDKKSIQSSQTQKSRQNKSAKITKTFEQRKLTQPLMNSEKQKGKNNQKLLCPDYQLVKQTQNINNNHQLKIKIKKNENDTDQLKNEQQIKLKSLGLPTFNYKDLDIQKQILDDEINNFDYDIFLKLDSQIYVDHNTQEGSIQIDQDDENTKIQIQLSFSNFCRFLLIINGKSLDLPQSEEFLSKLNIRYAIENLKQQIDLQFFELQQLKVFDIQEKQNAFDSLIIEGAKYASILNQCKQLDYSLENYYSVNNDIQLRNYQFNNQKNDTASFSKKEFEQKQIMTLQNEQSQNSQKSLSTQQNFENEKHEQFENQQLISNLNTFRPLSNTQNDKLNSEDNFDLSSKNQNFNNQKTQQYSIQNSQSSYSKYQQSLTSSIKRGQNQNNNEDNYLSLTASKQSKFYNKSKNPIQTQFRKKSQNVQTSQKNQIQDKQKQTQSGLRNTPNTQQKQGNYLSKNMNKYIDEIVKQKQSMQTKRESENNDLPLSNLQKSTTFNIESKQNDILQQFNISNPYVSFINKIQNSKEKNKQTPEQQQDDYSENIQDLFLKEQHTSTSQNTHSQIRRSKKERQMNSNKKYQDVEQNGQSDNKINNNYQLNEKEIDIFDTYQEYSKKIGAGDQNDLQNITYNEKSLQNNLIQQVENKNDKENLSVKDEWQSEQKLKQKQIIPSDNSNNEQKKIQKKIDEIIEDKQKIQKNEIFINLDDIKIENGPLICDFESERISYKKNTNTFNVQDNQLQIENIQENFHNTGPFFGNENQSSQRNELNSDQREYLNQLQMADINTQDEASSNQNTIPSNIRANSSILMIGYPTSPKFNSIQSMVSNHKISTLDNDRKNKKQFPDQILSHKNSLPEEDQSLNTIIEIEDNYDIKKFFTLHQTSVQILQEAQNENKKKSLCSSLSFRNGIEDKFDQKTLTNQNEDVQTVTNIPVNEQLQMPDDLIKDSDTNLLESQFAQEKEYGEPLIFQNLEIKQKSVQELLKDAMADLEEQIEEDSDLEDGNYFFTLKKCPKTDHQATLIQAKKLDSVILEESEEQNQSSQSQSHSLIFSHSQAQLKPYNEEKNKLSSQNLHSQNSLKLIRKKNQKDTNFQQQKLNSNLFVVEEGQDDAALSLGDHSDDNGRNLSEQDNRNIHNYPQSLSDLKKIIFSDQKKVYQKSQIDNETSNGFSPKQKVNRNQVGLNLLNSKKYQKGLFSSQSWKKYKTNNK